MFTSSFCSRFFIFRATTATKLRWSVNNNNIHRLRSLSAEFLLLKRKKNFLVVTRQIDWVVFRGGRRICISLGIEYKFFQWQAIFTVNRMKAKVGEDGKVTRLRNDLKACIVHHVRDVNRAVWTWLFMFDFGFEKVGFGRIGITWKWFESIS
jgi:hypothetical protein